ncbi:12415_t:CDS:2 [Entrophospora sp. SA101]|nr:7705_t:CDS:2 [Entrophospora sp. SA101]CAJ0762702.1 12415_t:CDS:2 [Entrophospora sp. SA101]CAJ0847336.1 15522_t:CDS:2 [Entrophospora sp. SA101]
MTNQNLIVSTIFIQSRQQKNGKSNINNQKNYTSLLSEENLKLHIGMMPSAKETKANLVLGYVDLQKQLVTLEAQLRKEAEVAQEKFNSLLPENTPSVIPEIININSIPLIPNHISLPLTIENEDNNSYTLADNSYKASPNTVEEIPTLLDSLIKNFQSLPPLKNIFISANPKPPHQRNNSGDTTNTFYLQQNSPTSSIHNNPTYTSLQNSPFPPSTPMTCNAPHNSSPLLNSTPSSPNHEKSEIDAYKSVSENRDSGISFVSPGRKSGNHSREHSISSLLRKIGTFHNFNKDNHSQDETRKEKSWGNISSMVIGYKDPNSELLAFRYPSSKDVYNITGDFVGGEENDNSNGDDIIVGVTFEDLQVTNFEDYYTAPDVVE